MEHLAAEFTLRQASLREAECRPAAAADSRVGTQPPPAHGKRRGPGKQSGAKGGGGGALRAYVHVNALFFSGLGFRVLGLGFRV